MIVTRTRHNVQPWLNPSKQKDFMRERFHNNNNYYYIKHNELLLNDNELVLCKQISWNSATFNNCFESKQSCITRAYQFSSDEVSHYIVSILNYWWWYSFCISWCLFTKFSFIETIFSCSSRSESTLNTFSAVFKS